MFKNIMSEKIKNLKISSKLVLSFGIVVILLVLVIAYQRYSLSYLKSIQADSARSGQASEKIRDINTNMANIYAIFADLLINRNFTDFEQNLEAAKAQKEKDMAEMNQYIDTDEDRVRFSETDNLYKEMLDLLEQAYPIVKSSEGITGEIMVLDAGIDTYRSTVAEDIQYFVDKYSNEAKASVLNFDKQYIYAYRIGIILTLLALVVCGFLIYLLYNYIVNNIKTDVEFADRLAAGDLTGRIEVKSGDEFGNLATSLNTTVDNLEKMLRNIQSGMTVLVQAVEEIASGNQNLSQRTAEQASSVEEIAATIEESSAAYRQNYDNAKATSTLANKSSELAQSGGTLVDDAIVMMEKVNSSSRKISEIIDLINGIAFQTNLLALNAAVEAARAGDQGRGFAVVAGEVRNLAQRAAGAAKEIGSLIQESVNNATDGTEKVNSSGTALKEIIQSSLSVNNMVSEITIGMDEQKSGLDQINSAITDLDSMTQQNAALVEEIASSSEEMRGQAMELNEMISIFKINEIS
jgi:methyl-accepting chemotaxis protein